MKIVRSEAYNDDFYIAKAEKSLKRAEHFRLKGDGYLTKGNARRADVAYRLSEREIVRAQTSMCFVNG